MRELIFRGKQKYGGWVEGYYLKTTYFDSKEEKHFIIKPIDIRTDGLNACHYEVIPETVGQFTGLLDKNKKKIFEGDILRVADRRIWYSYKLFMLSESEKINILKELPCVDRVVEIPRIYDWRFEKDKEYWEVIGNTWDCENDS